MKKKEESPEVVLVIRFGPKKKKVLKQWMYYSVVEELGWNGFGREEAKEVAEWARRAKEGEEKEVNGVMFTVEAMR